MKHKRNSDTNILLLHKGVYRVLSLSEVLYLESEGSYTHFMLLGGIRHISSKPIAYYEMLLKDYDFVRIHQRYVVNKCYVSEWFSMDGLYVRMSDGIELPVSRLKRTDLIKLYLH